nr:DUF2388 domain-containing protein [Luteimonas sp. BDR2-5]
MAGVLAAGPVAAENSSYVTSVSSMDPGDFRWQARARADAAAFVASDGRMRSARLDAALRRLRAEDPQALAIGDRQLARHLLTL